MNTDPLAELKDIQLPDPVSFWPLAPGWWLLIFILIIGILIAIGLWRKQPQHKQTLKTLALTELSALNDLINNQASADYIQQLNALLKRTAIAQGLTYCSQLSGNEWLCFLEQNSDDLVFKEGVGRHLATVGYERNPTVTSQELTQLQNLCEQWIKQIGGR